MSATRAAVIPLLNGLIEICRDGEEGYRAAAESVKNPDLRALFSSLSHQRQQFARDLAWMIRDLGAPVEQSRMVAGAIPRGWARLKFVPTSGDEESLLAECEQGEDSAVAKYREALGDEKLPARIHDVLRLQLMGVEGAHRHLREVRENFHSAHATDSLFRRRPETARL
jgi:uncharacterized protein (TIGR02284 family)